MSPKPPTLSALAILLVCGTACGTIGKHYDADNADEPPPTIDLIKTAAIFVDSVPSGAIIRLNGIKIGTGPVFARPELDEGGSLVSDTLITADYSTFAAARGSTETIRVTYRGGDLPPRRLILARAADGGILSIGGPLPSN